jgi:hypothetical protein
MESKEDLSAEYVQDGLHDLSVLIAINIGYYQSC